MDELVLAAVRWEPEVRGLVIIVGSVLILCGSVYLLLATNLGVRQGFLVAMTGLAGWMLIMGVVWWVYGIGLQGRPPEWKAREVVTGSLELSAVEEAQVFPEAWEELPAGDADAAEAQAAAAAVLTAEDDPDAPFQAASDFVVLDTWRRGGEDKWLGLKHEPHFTVVRVQQVVEQRAQPGQPPPRPVADETQPVVSVVLVRDLGSLRVPAATMTISSLVLFGLLAHVLHRRDKELMAAAAGEG